jgi:hypothetical protein
MMKTQTRLVPRTQHTTAITMIPVVGSLGAATPANRLYLKKWFRLQAQLQLKKLVPVHDLFRYGQTVVVFQVLLIRIRAVLWIRSRIRIRIRNFLPVRIQNKMV